MAAPLKHGKLPKNLQPIARELLNEQDENVEYYCQKWKSDEPGFVSDDFPDYFDQFADWPNLTQAERRQIAAEKRQAQMAEGPTARFNPETYQGTETNAHFHSKLGVAGFLRRHLSKSGPRLVTIGPAEDDVTDSLVFVECILEPVMDDVRFVLSPHAKVWPLIKKFNGTDVPFLPQGQDLRFKADVALSAFDPARKRWRIVAVFEIERTSLITAAKKEFLRSHGILLFRVSATEDAVEDDEYMTYTSCDIPADGDASVALVQTLLQIDLGRRRIRALAPPNEDSESDDSASDVDAAAAGIAGMARNTAVGSGSAGVTTRAKAAAAAAAKQ